MYQIITITVGEKFKKAATLKLLRKSEQKAWVYRVTAIERMVIISINAANSVSLTCLISLFNH